MVIINSETDRKEIDRINEMLKQTGIRIISTDSLSLEIDPAVLRRFSSRGAGRPYKPLKENGFLAHVTKGEIKERMKKESAAEIAASLGISRRTLFRRLAETESDSQELL